MTAWKLIAAALAAVLLTACVEVDTTQPGGGGASGRYVPIDRQ